MMEQEVGLLTAFGAGVLSFLSPCVLPLVPGYLSLLSGITVGQMREATFTREAYVRLVISALFFVLGFSVVFIAMGASATAIGQFIIRHQLLLAKIAGVIIVIFGLHIMGVFKLPFLMSEKRMQMRQRPAGMIGAFLMGLAFAFGWTPCVGPILGAILMVASTRESLGQGVLLLSFYALGLGIPFMLTALASGLFFRFFERFKTHLRKVEIVSGALLIIIGILVFTNMLQRFVTLFM